MTFFFGKGERIVRGNRLPRFLRRERGRKRGTRKRGPGRGTDKNMVEKLAGQGLPPLAKACPIESSPGRVLHRTVPGCLFFFSKESARLLKIEPSRLDKRFFSEFSIDSVYQRRGQHLAQGYPYIINVVPMCY